MEGSKMLGFLKKKWKETIIILSCLIVVSFTSVMYAILTSNYIFNESSMHLEEVTEQINDKFKTVVQSNVDTLNAIKHHINYSIDHMSSDDYEKELDKFFISEQTARNLTDIVFISSNESEISNGDGGTIFTIECKSALNEHKTADFHFKRSISTVLQGQQSSVLCWDGAGNLYLMFTVDYRDADSEECNHGYNYDGFSYHAMGFLYNVKDMESLLDVETFNGKGIGYITRSDGMILVQVDSPRFSEGTNYIDFLGDVRYIDLKDNSIEKIKQDFTNTKENGETNQKAETILIYDKELHIEYYLTYQPVGFDDWMFIMLVPSDVINRSMKNFRLSTILVMVVLFAIISAIIIWYTSMLGRRKVKAKELETENIIKTRDKLFDLFTLNSNSLFILFSTKDFSASYVSSNITEVLGLDIDLSKKDIRNLMVPVENKDETIDREKLESLPIASMKETDTHMRNVKTHEQYWFHTAMYRALYDGDENFILLFSDRSKEHHMRNSLEDALSIAKSANEAKSNFLSNMSHDIRTPMNAIIGYATLLMKDAERADKVREYVRKITYSSEHLLSLINDILDMSRIESGKTNLNLEDFDLPEMLEEIHTIVAPQAKTKKHEFTISTKGKIPDKITSDKLRLKQVLINLLSNSVKYTPEGGHIQLHIETIKKLSKYVILRIVVKDDGIGMSEKYVKEIFEPFSREETAKTKGIQGTGLGMAITKNIVDLMGGSIKVESELNKGSTFTLELKILIAKKDEDESHFWEKHKVSRVLVVDNDEDICLNIQELMKDTGVTVDYATSGKQAIQMVRDTYNTHNDYSIILLDWKMPEMDGIETARHIREIVGSSIQILVLTSYNFEEIEEEAKTVGIDYYVSKPFFVSHFKTAVEKLMTQSTATEEKKQSEVISLSGLKVLAAEDNEINAEILVELLDMEDVQCDIAYNGKEALTKFENSKPGQYDFIFMDVQMPVMNGYEATKAIRECNHPTAKTIPIIAMTANAFDDDVKAALDSGMNAHIAKPIDMDKLKNTINDLRHQNK